MEEIEINLADAKFITNFGRNLMDQDVLTEASVFLETSPVTALSETMSSVLTAMKGADPRKISKRPGWFSRLTGRDIFQEITVAVSQGDLQDLLAQAEENAERLEDFLENFDRLQNRFSEGHMTLVSQLEAGRAYLAKHPGAGRPEADSISDNPRDRFERRLGNMATLAASNEMTIHQLKLAKVQAIDILDRWHEIKEVLLPVWRQNVLAVSNQRLLDPETSMKAVAAHESLQAAVAASLKGLPSSH